MSDMTIVDFCDRHSACQPGREWALQNCQTLGDVWATARPKWLVWVATRPGVLSHRDLVRLALYSAKSCESHVTDCRSREAIAVVERLLSGTADKSEAESAACAACSAACAAESAACAARSASCAARSASYARFAAWLRENVTPDFAGGST